MKLVKLLNNNCVVSYDDSNKMIILMGSGIGFHMRKGDEIDENRIEKIFRLDNDTNSRFETILKDIPMHIVLVSDKVITHIKSKIDKVISDSIYVTLTDHIWTSVERIKAGIKFDQMLLTNVKELYKQEYDVALECAAILTNCLGISFDETEANFVALHIISSELNGEMSETYKILNIVKKIGCYVERFLEVSTSTLQYERFLIHCRFLVQKIIIYKKTDNEEIMTREFINFGENEKKIKQCVEYISDLLNAECNYSINENEKTFLMIHLLRLCQKDL